MGVKFRSGCRLDAFLKRQARRGPGALYNHWTFLSRFQHIGNRFSLDLVRCYIACMKNMILVLLVLLSARSLACGFAGDVQIEFPQGLSLPAQAADRLSRDLGVGAVEYTGLAESGPISCIITNEAGKDFVIDPSPQQADVLPDTRGTFFFLEKNQLFQLSCAGAGLGLGGVSRAGQLTLINEAMNKRIIISADVCVSSL